MMNSSNAVGTALVLLAPVGLIYSWWFYGTQMSWKSSGWRGRLSLVSLVIVSLAVVMWPIMEFFTPRADLAGGVGMARQVHWVFGWGRVALWSLLAALVLGLLGRPRLILPLVVACIGMGLFWVFTTMP